jgi:hypothetical protein
MRAELCALSLLVSACSSQVSLGSEDDHVASTGSEASTSTGGEASVVTIDASAQAIDATADASSTGLEATVDAAPGDEHSATDAAHYDPCAAKSCGAPCTVCDPHDAHCVEPPGQKQCNAHDQCVTTPICPADAGNTTG